EQAYAHLWFLCSGIFHPLFVMGGIPRVSDEAAHARFTALRKFIQYVLIPLTVLYLAILYLYTAKILLSAELPNGWVGLPVLVLATVGILASLLLRPWSLDATEAWARRFHRAFFAATLPLTALLAVSIGVRVQAYGVTEPRYYVVVLTIWLALICATFALRPQTTVRLIPWSLLMLAAASSIGPWGASAWSLRSQIARVHPTL